MTGGRVGYCTETPGASRAAKRWSQGNGRPPGDERAWWVVWAWVRDLPWVEEWVRVGD